MPILICYDGSPSASCAIETAAASLAHQPAILLNVWTAPEAVHADAFAATSNPRPSIDDLSRLSVERAKEIGEHGRAHANALGLDVEVRTEQNRTSIWETILEVADETGATLIVIGTHGSTAVQSALLGSVSNAVLHHSKHPVLVVPAERR